MTQIKKNKKPLRENLSLPIVSLCLSRVIAALSAVPPPPESMHKHPLHNREDSVMNRTYISRPVFEKRTLYFPPFFLTLVLLTPSTLTFTSLPPPPGTSPHKTPPNPHNPSSPAWCWQTRDSSISPSGQKNTCLCSPPPSGTRPARRWCLPLGVPCEGHLALAWR